MSTTPRKLKDVLAMLENYVRDTSTYTNRVNHGASVEVIDVLEWMTPEELEKEIVLPSDFHPNTVTPEVMTACVRAINKVNEPVIEVEPPPQSVVQPITPVIEPVTENVTIRPPTLTSKTLQQLKESVERELDSMRGSTLGRASKLRDIKSQLDELDEEELGSKTILVGDLTFTDLETLLGKVTRQVAEIVENRPPDPEDTSPREDTTPMRTFDVPRRPTSPTSDRLSQVLTDFDGARNSGSSVSSEEREKSARRRAKDSFLNDAPPITDIDSAEKFFKDYQKKIQEMRVQFENAPTELKTEFMKKLRALEAQALKVNEAKVKYDALSRSERRTNTAVRNEYIESVKAYSDRTSEVFQEAAVLQVKLAEQGMKERFGILLKQPPITMTVEVGSFSKYQEISTESLKEIKRLTAEPKRSLLGFGSPEPLSKEDLILREYYKGIKIEEVTSAPNNKVTIKIPRDGDNSRQDEINRSYGNGHVKITLNARPDDKAIFVLIASNGPFLSAPYKPLKMSVTNDPETALKIYEAAIRGGKGQDAIQLNARDIELINADPKLKERYELLKGTEPEKLNQFFKDNQSRPLGQEFSPEDVRKLKGEESTISLSSERPSL